MNIKPTDLRHGNILQYYIGEDGCKWEETKIDWQDIKWCAENNENFNQVHRPVPLTRKLLKRFGFKPCCDDMGDLFLRKGDVWIRDARMLYFSSSGDLMHYHIRNIQYVHQVQNLYFTLTGQELQLTNQ